MKKEKKRVDVPLPARSNRITKRMPSIENLPGYVGDRTTDECKELLKDKEDYTYAIRYSVKSDFEGYWIICKYKGKYHQAEVKHPSHVERQNVEFAFDIPFEIGNSFKPLVATIKPPAGAKDELKA